MKQQTQFSWLLLFSSILQIQAVRGEETDQPLAPAEAASMMKVPPDFQVTLFAGEPDVMQPIGFCIDDRNRLWVAEAYSYPQHTNEGNDRIIILEDSDGDGSHDKRTVFCEGLNYVTGIEVGFGGVWVMSPPNMYFFPDENQDDVPDSEAKVLLDGFGNHANAHNLANGFAWGPDGWLYATHGRTNWSMIGIPGSSDDQRQRFDGGVWRYHPVQHIWEPFADGTTNPWGIDWNDYGHAFICNCVNPHLFQVIQGAHYEPWRGRKSSEFAYQRIETIADHLHFVGLGNVRNGIGSAQEDAVGGGHAHCGTMIYLGDQLPREYRNTLMTNNIHGRRINNDIPIASGSGYVASHGPDVMRSADPWFMGVTLASGASGEIYVSDWSDTGECHSTRNTRRSTGRIFRLTYKQSHVPAVDLRSKSNAALVELQLRKNDWQVRHARRRLQERSAAGDDMSSVHAGLTKIFQNNDEVTRKLRAFWALKVTGGLSNEFLLAQLGHSSEHIRSWAIDFLCEDEAPASPVMQRFVDLATSGKSPLVRLHLASALQRLPLRQRWQLAEALVSRKEDCDDQNLPLMDWYGIEPLIEDDLPRYVRLAAASSIPRVRINIARRVASSDKVEEGLRLIAQQLTSIDAARVTEILEGTLQGLEGRRGITAPKGWRNTYTKLQDSTSDSVVELSTQLALVLGDTDAITSLRERIADSGYPVSKRASALNALLSQTTPDIEGDLLALVSDKPLRKHALKGLAKYNATETVNAILENYKQFDSSEKQAALQTLASRKSWGLKLVQAAEAKEIPQTDLTAFTVRQLRSLGDPQISEQLTSLWGEVRDTPRDRAKKISNLKSWLTAEALRNADLERGHALFKKQCSNCHRFFGEGGKIGPDITGAQRTNLDYLLENIIDPSAAVSKDYRMHIIQTIDGRVLNGLIETENENTLTVQTVDQRMVLPKEDVELRKLSPVSIMPAGLLDQLSDQETRDLIGYLQRTTTH